MWKEDLPSQNNQGAVARIFPVKQQTKRKKVKTGPIFLHLFSFVAWLLENLHTNPQSQNKWVVTIKSECHIWVKWIKPMENTCSSIRMNLFRNVFYIFKTLQTFLVGVSSEVSE